MAENGTKKVAVVKPGFISDCVETLEEIGIVLRDDFMDAGGSHFTTVPCLNDTDDSLDVLQSLAERNLQGW
jgi:ferrochelatase